MNRALDEVDHRKPKAALLIDYPGFNIRLARALREGGSKYIIISLPNSGHGIVVALKYYVRPSIRCSSYSLLRLHCLKNRVSRLYMLVILWWSRSNECRPHRVNLFRGVRVSGLRYFQEVGSKRSNEFAPIGGSRNSSRAAN